MAITTYKAKEKAKSLGQNATTWTNQQLADFLGEDVIKYNAQGQPIVLAYAGGAAPKSAAEKPLTAAQAQQAAAAFTKNDMIAEIQAAAKKFYNNTYSPFYSTGYTPKAKQEFQTAAQTEAKTLLDKAAKYGISGQEFQKIYSDTVSAENTSQAAQYEKINADRGGLLGVLDKTTPIITNIAAAIASGGLSLPQQIGVEAAISLVQGASVEETIRNIGAQVAGTQAVDALKTVSSQITNPELKAAFNGAVQSATAAAIQGRDITQAALIGAGISAATTSAEQATESAGTGLKAPGQVAAPSAAGEASLKTDVAGTAPEIGTGTGISARPTDLLSQQLAPYASQIGDVISGGGGTVQPRYTGAADIITPPSFAQYLPEYQAPESTSGSMKRGLSTGEREALSEALKLGFSSMLGGGGGGGSQTTYAAGDTQRTTALPVGQYSPGSQALAQALRIGDVGAPIFGTDKDKGKKSGWNVESLRYMGDVGEA